MNNLEGSGPHNVDGGHKLESNGCGDEQNNSTAKQDLRRTKAELFNKLIGSQSQQMIVTPSKSNGNENLDKVNSLTSSKSNHEINVGEAYHQQQQTSQNGQQQTKREPVIFSRIRSRWYTNEEVASILTSFSSHPEWQTNELQVRPKSGAVLLYSREKVRYRQDGYCWKKRKNGRTTREDHMKLKVQGIECIYGCYVHSAILPTFHRRCYWLLQNPDIVLVHYLNQPPDDQNKMMLTFNSSLLEADTRRSWTNEEIIEEIGSVFGGISQIHHTLSINFPSSTEIIHRQSSQLNDCQNEDRMIEMSPQSHTTSNSERMSEQVEMTVSDNHQQPQQMICSSESTHSQDLNNDENNNRDARSRELDEDEMMAISQDSNSNQQTLRSNNSNLNNLNCDGRADDDNENRHKLLQRQQDDTISMTFDIVNECSENGTNNINNPETSTVCYNFVTSPNNQMNLDNINVMGGDDGNSILNSSSTLCAQATNDGQMDQSPCSPVTQIYNKIVDDIETYVLPLEPNQFDSSHHHHHHHHHHHPGMSISLPDQSMDISAEHPIQHHSQHGGNSGGGQQQQPQQQQMNHHQQNQSQQGPPQQQQQQQQAVSQQFNDSGCNHGPTDLNHDQSDCSVDFTSCDLFGNCALGEMEQADGRDVSGGDSSETNNLLLTDFNLSGSGGVPGQVADDLGASVVDTLANADDLGDMMMGMQPSSNDVDTADQASNLLVDNNSLDLFNFKPSSCEQKQQLDVKSTTSDTDTLNRLSPMAPLVPRCNSTDNAMQPAVQRLDQYQHHLSSHFLANAQPQNTLMNNTFSEYNHHHNNLNSHRSATSTDPSNSTSCSPSPSSSSLVTTGGHPSSAQSAYLESPHCSTGSSSHSFIKLPLQQRQKSEQREPSNSVLSSLLPKALSLDGSDLSATSHHQHHHHRGIQSPLVGPYGTSRQNQQQHHQNLLLIPPTNINNKNRHQTQQTITNQQQQQSSNRHSFYQRPSMPLLSPTTTANSMSMDNSGKILIDSPNQCSNHHHHYHPGSMLASNVCPLQPSIMEYAKLHQATVSDVRLLPILDYVPNWSTSSGGTKLLIIGNWSSLLAADKRQQQSISENRSANHDSSGGFFVVFDDLIVPATLIQDNVLRCYSPSHEPGFITLKVLFMNRIVSEQVLFEMRPACSSSIQSSSSSSVVVDHQHNHNHHSNAFSGCNNSVRNNHVVQNEAIKK